MLLQLATLPKVPGTHSVVQAASPQLGAIVGDVYAAGPIRVALKLPMEATEGRRMSLRESLTTRLAATLGNRWAKGKLRPKVSHHVPQSLNKPKA